MNDEFDPYFEWLKIPPSEQPPNHYRLLETARFESDPEVIDAAVERLVARLQNLSNGLQVAHAQRMLNDVAKARLCLSDPAAKRSYDEQLKRSISFRRLDAPDKRVLNSAASLIDPRTTAASINRTPETKQPSRVNHVSKANAKRRISSHRRQSPPSKKKVKKHTKPNKTKASPIGWIAGMVAVGLGMVLFLSLRTTNAPEPVTAAGETTFANDPLSNAKRQTDRKTALTHSAADQPAIMRSPDKGQIEERSIKTLPSETSLNRSGSSLAVPAAFSASTKKTNVLKPNQLSRFEKLLKQFVHVEGIVTGTRVSTTGKTRYLQFSQPPDQSITVFMFTRDVGDTLSKEILATYIGKRIQVRGEVKREFGTNMLGVRIVSDNQIEVIE